MKAGSVFPAVRPLFKVLPAKGHGGTSPRPKTPTGPFPNLWRMEERPGRGPPSPPKTAAPPSPWPRREASHPPDGIVLYVLGIEAGVQLHHWLEGPQHAVDSDEQQLELGIGRAAGQPFL